MFILEKICFYCRVINKTTNQPFKLECGCNVCNSCLSEFLMKENDNQDKITTFENKTSKATYTYSYSYLLIY